MIDTQMPWDAAQSHLMRSALHAPQNVSSITHRTAKPLTANPVICCSGQTPQCPANTSPATRQAPSCTSHVCTSDLQGYFFHQLALSALPGTPPGPSFPAQPNQGLLYPWAQSQWGLQLHAGDPALHAAAAQKPAACCHCCLGPAPRAHCHVHRW